MPEFHAQYTRLDGIEPAVVAFDFMVVLPGLSMIAQHFGGSRNPFVIGCDRAAFTACPQILARIKAEGGRVSHRAGLAPAIFFLREILGAMRLAGVFNHDESKAVRQFKDWIHVRGLPVQVNGDHRGHRFAERAVDKAARAAVELALRFHVLAQFQRIHRIRASVHIHEIRTCSCLGNRLCGRNKCVGNRKDNVARLDTGAREGKSQRVRATADANTMLGAAILGKFSFKSFHGGTANERGRPDGCLECSYELVLKFNVRCHQIYKRNRPVLSHFCVLASDGIERSIFAGFPATMTLGGTSRVTTLPAPTMELSPTTTLERTVAPDPMDAPPLMVVASTRQSLSVCNPPSAVVARG